MSYTDNVADFLESVGAFYESVPPSAHGDLQMLVGDLMEKVSSRGSSPQRSDPGSNGSPISSRPDSPDSDSEAEEFIDSMEVCGTHLIFNFIV